LVINVAGSIDSIGGAGFTVFGSGATVLFNYYQASALTLGSSAFTGSVLAPFANVTSSGGGNFNGNLIAGSFSGSIEFHNTDLFSGSLASQAPEPGSVMLAGAGLTLLGLILRKRVVRKS
jgi:choice-of-anchor A domain-containing protein